MRAKGPRMSRKTHRSSISGKLAATSDATAPPMECPTKENVSHPRDLRRFVSNALHPTEGSSEVGRSYGAGGGYGSGRGSGSGSGGDDNT